MKMKNYLLYEVCGDSNKSSLAINVSVSHREILRIHDRLLSENSDFKVARVVSGIESIEYTDDLYGSETLESRFFRIVKK